MKRSCEPTASTGWRFLNEGMGFPNREKLRRSMMGLTTSSTQSWGRVGFQEPTLLLTFHHWGFSSIGSIPHCHTVPQPSCGARFSGPNFPLSSPSLPTLPISLNREQECQRLALSSSLSLALSQNPKSSLVKAVSWFHSDPPASGFFFELKSSSWSHQKWHEKSDGLGPMPDHTWQSFGHHLKWKGGRR